MLIWILDSESGVKLLYASLRDAKIDSDISSGFLTVFRQFFMVEFREEIESIELGGLRWIYIIESSYKLLFIAADNKQNPTKIMRNRLKVIKNAFIKEYTYVWKKRNHSWDGDITIFTPFLDTIKNYYTQWEKVESLIPLADFFDVLGIFQNIFIALRNIIEQKMYSKSRQNIFEKIEKSVEDINSSERFQNKHEFEHISYSTEEWITIVDSNLLDCDKKLVIEYLKSILSIFINSIESEKGTSKCLKYFHEEGIYPYILNKVDLLRDLNLDMFLLNQFLLLKTEK
ncbi:MAG: hypothetical protein GF311_07885 [Candidatus Lokiarchaeota archaeon]|nr:hypothetical protein [Candidatus Lokiarchaeota archaeon]